MDIKKIVVSLTRVISTPINFIIFKLNAVNYKSWPAINGTVKVLQRSGKGKVDIGENVTINSAQSFNMIGGSYQTTLMIRNGGELTIGNNVGISNTAIVCANSITIEDDVFIGGGTKIWDTDFHSIRYEDRVNVDECIVTKPVVIKKGAFIGGGCTILKGVTIGEKCVVGAGSVVTKSIPDGEIWGGNPAKFIKRI